jgi:hypothetical protein
MQNIPKYPSYHSLTDGISWQGLVSWFAQDLSICLVRSYRMDLSVVLVRSSLLDLSRDLVLSFLMDLSGGLVRSPVDGSLRLYGSLRYRGSLS